MTFFGCEVPLVAAPMAGGPSTPALVVAAARAGGLGFLAAGYKTVEALGAQIAEVRAAGVPFGVNVFAPNPVPVDPGDFRRYAAAIAPDAEALGLTTRDAVPVETDDEWSAKLALLLADPVPVVSFTFAIPSAAVVAALRKAGTTVVQTVTSAREAQAASHVDALVVQASAAGAHSGTLTPATIPPEVPLAELLASVRAAVDHPLLAAGGLATPADVKAALHAGADAAVVGTVLLRTPESGAVYKGPFDGFAGTVVTRAFTGRPARALRNGFVARHTAHAPLGYPAVHHLTSPMRKAAAAAGDLDRLNLWAGTGYRHASTEPVATVLGELAREL